MKHILLRLILVAGVLVAIPVGLCYGFLYESNDTSYFVKDESFDNDHFVTSKMVKSFDNTVAEEKISFSLTQDDLNQILYRACESAFPNNMHKELKGMQILIEDDKYVFNVDLVPVSFFLTRFQLVANLEETEDAFVFHLEDIRIGRASHIGSMALSMASYFVNDDFIDSAFASCGLTIDCSLSSRTLTYRKEQLGIDLKNLLGDSNDSTSLYTGIISDLVSSNILSTDFYRDSSISFDLDLKPLSTNELYVTEDKNLTDFNISKYNNNLKSLLDDGSIDNTDYHDTIVLSYLINGYDALEENNRAYLDSVDLSSIGIKDKANYQGYYHPSASVSVENVIKNNINSIVNAGITIDEDTVNDYIKTTALIGTCYALTYKGLIDTEYDANYIVLDNAYVNFLDDKMYLNIGVSMNGYETTLILDASVKEKTQYGLILSTDKVFYGTHEINEDLKKELFKIIASAFTSSGWLTFNGETGEFTIDFETYIKNNSGALKDKLGIDVCIKGDSLNSDGYLLLKGTVKS